MNKIQVEAMTSDELLSKIRDIVGAAVAGLSVENRQNEYKLLTKAETAKMFSISIRSLHNWNQNGILRPYTIGNRVYYRSDEVEKALFLKQ